MLNRLSSELAPLLIIEEIKSHPRVMNMLRSYAKDKGLSIEECFSGTLTQDKIALLSHKEINKAVEDGAFLYMDKTTPMKHVSRQLGKVLEGYLND